MCKKYSFSLKYTQLSTAAAVLLNISSSSFSLQSFYNHCGCYHFYLHPRITKYIGNRVSFVILIPMHGKVAVRNGKQVAGCVTEKKNWSTYEKHGQRSIINHYQLFGPCEMWLLFETSNFQVNIRIDNLNFIVIETGQQYMTNTGMGQRPDVRFCLAGCDRGHMDGAGKIFIEH